MIGGSLKIWQSKGWFCIRFHFFIKTSFKVDTEGWYCTAPEMIPTPKRLWPRNDSHLFLGWPSNDPNQFLEWNGIPSRKKPLLMVKKSWPTNQPMYMQISWLLISRIWRLLGEHPLHFFNLWAGLLVEFRENFEPARRLLPLVLSWLTCGKSTCEVDEKKMTRQLYRVLISQVPSLLMIDHPIFHSL